MTYSSTTCRCCNNQVPALMLDCPTCGAPTEEDRVPLPTIYPWRNPHPPATLDQPRGYGILMWGTATVVGLVALLLVASPLLPCNQQGNSTDTTVENTY